MVLAGSLENIRLGLIDSHFLVDLHEPCRLRRIPCGTAGRVVPDLEPMIDIFRLHSYSRYMY